MTSDHRPGRSSDGAVPPARFDLSIFDQSQVWTTAEGDVRRLDELHPSDRRELMDWLLRNARHFYLEVLTRTLGANALSSGRVPDALFLSAREWMASTTLFAELDGGGREMAELVGPFWSAARVVQRLGLAGPAEVLEWATAGRLLLLRDGSGVALCPVWQFVELSDGWWRVADGVSVVLEVLKDADAWAVAMVLSVPAPELGGRVPRDVFSAAVAAEDVEALGAFARHVAAEWR